MAENKGIQYINIIAAGGTQLVAADDGIDKYMIESAGSITLTSNWSIAGSGTPRYGTTFTVQYFADITPNGNSLTFFGVVMPDNLANKNVEIEATYDGSAYKVVFKPSLAEAGVIPAAALEVSQDTILTNSYANSSGLLLSLTTAEQEALSITIPGGTLNGNAQNIECELYYITAANANTKSVRLRIQQGATDVVFFDSGTMMSTAPNNNDVRVTSKLYYQTGVQAYITNQSNYYNGTSYDIRLNNSGPIGSIDFTQDLTIKLTAELASGLGSDLIIRTAVFTIKK
jgi:hypothetical protein